MLTHIHAFSAFGSLGYGPVFSDDLAEGHLLKAKVQVPRGHPKDQEGIPTGLASMFLIAPGVLTSLKFRVVVITD